jgi:ankyrin repeat protein
LSAAAADGHVDIANLCMPQEPSGTIPSHYLDSLPRSKSKGWGPLHWAASNGHFAMSKFLTEKGMSVRDRALDGSTAADLARRHGHEEIVQLLELVLQESLNAKQDLKDPYEEQTQYDMRLQGTLLSTAILCIKANVFTVIAAKGLVKRDIFCKRSAKLPPSSC